VRRAVLILFAGRLLAGCASGLLVGGAGGLLAGCSGTGDPLRVAEGTPAAPAAAPVPTVSPAGRVLPAGADAAAVAVLAGGRRLAVGTREAIVLLDVAGGAPAEKITVAAPVRAIAALPGGGFRAVAGDRLVSDVNGRRSTWSLPGPASGLAVLDDGATAVVLPDQGTVVLLDASGATVRTLDTGGRPTAVAATRVAVGGPNRIGVVDSTRSTLTVFRADTGAREETVRAGDGATSVVGDETGRLYVTDTRDGELLIFSTGPLVLRQRYPVSGAPFGLAYQKANRTIWVTSTARNELLGFDVTGGTPREIGRHATARQPDAVAVEPDGGTLAVAGRAEGVVQVIGA
jgi:hypothetical protein